MFFIIIWGNPKQAKIFLDEEETRKYGSLLSAPHTILCLDDKNQLIWRQNIPSPSAALSDLIGA